MSLIEEAWRRTEHVIMPYDRQNSTAAPPGSTAVEGAVRPVSLRSFFISGLIVSTGLLSWYLVWSGRMLHPDSSSTAALSAQPAQQIIPPTGMELRPQLPTTPPPVAILSTYRLTGIVLGPGTPIAVINDRIVHRGETIDGLRLTEVSRSSAILERGLARITLRLGD